MMRETTKYIILIDLYSTFRYEAEHRFSKLSKSSILTKRVRLYHNFGNKGIKVKIRTGDP